MKVEGKARRLTIYIGEGDTWEGKPLASWIVLKARELGLAGATVLRGLEGFGANSRIHTSHILDLSTDLPLVIEIIDSQERIAAFLLALDRVVLEGLITIEDVEVIKYTHNEANQRGKG
jgi:PII-like signaling protein